MNTYQYLPPKIKNFRFRPAEKGLKDFNFFKNPLSWIKARISEGGGKSKKNRGGYTANYSLLSNYSLIISKIGGNYLNNLQLTSAAKYPEKLC